MVKSNVFENALLSLPWKTSEDVDQLISLGAKVKKEDAFDLLKKAIETNDASLLDKMIKLTGGAITLRKLDEVGRSGWHEYELLKNAVEKADISLLKTLVDNKFNLNATRSPLQHRTDALDHYDHAKSPYFDLLRFCCNDEEKKKYLESKGYKAMSYIKHTDREDGSELFDCIYTSDTKKLTELLKKGYNPNILVDMNDGNFSPLAEACIRNKPEIARILLFAGGLRIIGDYDDHKEILTIREFLNSGWLQSNKEKWEELAEQEELLRAKFPLVYNAYNIKESKEFGKSIAKSRKKALTDILSASSKSEAREIIRKFHEENPKQRTALKFKKEKQAE